jgi:hypothetical protein
VITEVVVPDSGLAFLVERLAEENTADILLELFEAQQEVEHRSLSDRDQALMQLWRTAARLVLVVRELSPLAPTERNDQK